MLTAIRADGLSKSFGTTEALRSLDLEVPEGEVIGYLGPNGAGKTTTIRCLLGLIGASAGRAEIFGVDVQARPVQAHRRIAYVPGEANLWPGLTGLETLHLLGRVHGKVDLAYRDVLIDRFPPGSVEASPRVLEGQSPKADPDCRPDDPSGPAPARRADEWSRSADGAGVSPMHRRVTQNAARRSFSPRTSSARSRPCAIGSAFCAKVSLSRSAHWPRCAIWPRCRSTPSSTPRRPTCPRFRVSRPSR